MTGERPLAVLHPITRLIIGGAQENTMLTADLMNRGVACGGAYEVSIACGEQTGPEGSLIEEVRHRGVPLKVVPTLRREVNPVADMRAILALRRIMTSSGGGPRFDIVHTHSSKAGVVGRIAARLAGVPTVVHTVHGWSFHDRMPAWKLHFYVALEKWACRFGQKMIVVADADIEKGLSRGIGRRDDYVVIRSGIELDRFGNPLVPRHETRRQLGIPADAMVVGSVTRLSEQKAPLDLIESFALVHRSSPRTRFVVVGDGPLRGKVESLLRERNLADAVVLTGLRRDIPELMAAFDVFTLNSLWEGLPRVLPQAMATGLPIVCTRADGSADAVEDGRNGLLVPRSNPAAAAAQILLLLSDRGLCKRMGEEGRRRATAYDVRTMVGQLDRLYRSLSGNRSGR
ncbi:MAG: glycosyltransferase family 4 protein [bacterium]